MMLSLLLAAPLWRCVSSGFFLFFFFLKMEEDKILVQERNKNKKIKEFICCQKTWLESSYTQLPSTLNIFFFISTAVCDAPSRERRRRRETRAWNIFWPRSHQTTTRVCVCCGTMEESKWRHAETESRYIYTIMWNVVDVPMAHKTLVRECF